MNWSREKRKRQQVATLLIEPTAEQEEETNRRADERVLSAMWQKSIIISDNDDINKLKRSKSAFSHSIAQNSNDHQNLKKNVIMSGNNNVSEDNYHGSSGISEKSNFRPSTNSKSKSQLTSMLVILFGPLLIIYLLNNCASCAQQMSQLNSQSNLLNLTTAPQSSLNEMVPSGQASSMSLMNTSNVKPLVLRNRSSGSGGESLTSASTITTTPLTVTSTVATGGAGGGDDDDSSDTPVEDVDVSEEEATSSTSETSNGDQSTGKLANVILGAASDGADLLVKKLKPPVDSNDSIDDSPVPGDDIDPESENSPKSGGKADVNEMDAKKEESMIRAAKQVAGEIIKDINGKLSQVNRTARHQAEMEAELKLAMETYAKWRQVGDDVIELFSRKLLPVIIEHGYDVDAGTVSGLLQVFNGIRGLKPWAMKLLDASAKIAPGILVGTQSDFGDYDECINIRADDPSGLVAGNPELMGELDPETGLYSSTLVGKYCLADIEFPKPPRQRLSQRNEELQTDFAPIELRRPLLNFSETAAFKETIFVETGNFFHMLYVDPLRVGICLTNKIDADNFAIVFNKLIAEFKVKIDFKGRCVTKYDKQHWTVQQVVSAYVISIACFLVCLCTLLDLLHMKLNKLPLPRSLKGWKCKFRITLFKYRPLFTSFSIIRNTKRLFKPQQQDSATRNKISSLQGSMSNKLLLHSSDHSKAASGTGLSTSASSTSSVSTASMAPDSSVESSPCIERRSSSVTGSAIRLIQGNGSDSASMVTSNASLANVALSHGGAKYLNSYSRANALAEQQPVDSLMQKQSQQPVSLMCLHGIRVITMTWMIVNHTYLFGGFFVLWAHRRLIDIAEWPKSVSFQMVLNGWLTVETYFFLSATIIVLNLMPLMKKRKFSYLSYIFHRLLRLLPAYIGLICLNFLWPLVSSGPVWLVKGKSFIQTPCENYLWTNFLFINNWIWPEKQVSFHLFLLLFLDQEK